MQNFEFVVRKEGCTEKACCPKIILEITETGFKLKTEDDYTVIDAGQINKNGHFTVFDLSDCIANKFVANKSPSICSKQDYQIQRKSRFTFSLTTPVITSGDC